MRRFCTNKGFTVVELIVALGLFTIVIGIASGVFIRSLRSQRLIIELLALNDDSSVTIEQMAREIRLGSGFSTPTPNQLDFTNAFGQPVTYQYNPIADTIERRVSGGSLESLTGDRVSVRDLSFILTGDAPADNLQPRITVHLEIGASSPLLAGFVMTLQTTLSPRQLDT